jgi:hypothetical protein
MTTMPLVFLMMMPSYAESFWDDEVTQQDLRNTLSVIFSFFSSYYLESLTSGMYNNSILVPRPPFQQPKTAKKY